MEDRDTVIKEIRQALRSVNELTTWNNVFIIVWNRTKPSSKNFVPKWSKAELKESIWKQTKNVEKWNLNLIIKNRKLKISKKITKLRLMHIGKTSLFSKDSFHKYNVTRIPLFSTEYWKNQNLKIEKWYKAEKTQLVSQRAKMMNKSNVMERLGVSSSSKLSPGITSGIPNFALSVIVSFLKKCYGKSCQVFKCKTIVNRSIHRSEHYKRATCSGRGRHIYNNMSVLHSIRIPIN